MFVYYSDNRNLSGGCTAVLSLRGTKDDPGPLTDFGADEEEEKEDTYFPSPTGVGTRTKRTTRKMDSGAGARARAGAGAPEKA
jgi:hypothetical protein